MNKLKILLKKFLIHILNSSEIKKGVLISGYSKGMNNVIFEGKNGVPNNCNFNGKIQIGYATTIGINNYIHGNITIGKYCQLGAYVAIHATNHPINYLSTYINKNLFQGELNNLKVKNEIVIGNDVWIGHNVIIVGNVKVGNGAILAAGCVVTKNVEPYSIVGGVPSKIIKKRFSDKQIQEIEKLQWWDKSEEELNAIKPLFFKDFSIIESIYD